MIPIFTDFEVTLKVMDNVKSKVTVKNHKGDADPDINITNRIDCYF